MVDIIFASLLLLLFSNVGCDQARDELKSQGILITVVSQPNEYHSHRAAQFRSQILQQARLLNLVAPTVLLLHEQWPTTGAWTILPVIPSIAREWSNRSAAVIFCGDETQIDLGRLMSGLSVQDLSQNLFLGRPLRDTEATIIHHFAFHEDPSKFAYPDLSACFLVSSSLIRHIAHQLEHFPPRMDFSIDASHELAMFIWNGGAGFHLTEASFLCGYVTNPAESGCATWQTTNFPHCLFPVEQGPSNTGDDELFFAVKTCQKYHADRLPVVKGTWAREVKRVTYFSDVEDPLIPTVTLGISNTERGHCAKLLAILKYAYNELNSNSFKWIAVVDDDTLISVRRLRKLLSCYNSSESVALGERYGYGLLRNGYDYITLGGGMVLSHVALRQVLESGTCTCATPDAPDDMTFGLCLKHLDIIITHLPYFHQARPADYAKDYLYNHAPVTFHRHWMNDPYRVYADWLIDDDVTPSVRDDL